MKPEKESKRLLSITQSMAKMLEFKVPEEKQKLSTHKKPEELFSLVIGMLGDYSNIVNTEFGNEKKKIELKSNLTFVSDFFNAYCNGQFDTENVCYDLLIGAVSYYFCDLPGSSQVLIDKIPVEYTYSFEASELDKLIIWLLRSNYKSSNTYTGQYKEELHNIETSLKFYFSNGSNEHELLQESLELRKKIHEYFLPREILFIDITCAIIRLKIENSSWKLLPQYTAIDVSIWANTINKKNFIKELWPAQKLLGINNIYKGTSAVIQMPTSSGKTKSIEIIIRSAFFADRTKLAVIVAPFIALCTEISSDLYKAFYNEINVDINQLNEALEDDGLPFFNSKEKNHIIVCTPEKLYYLLTLKKELADNIGLIIFDEGHQFDSGSRGITYELLLTELKVLLPNSCQKVLISAVISNSKEIAEWLSPNALAITNQNVTPTKKSIGFVDFSNQIPKIWFINPQTFEGEYFVPRVLPSRLISSNASNISLYLATLMLTEGTVAIFCGQKNSVTKLISTLALQIKNNERNIDLSSFGTTTEIMKISNLCSLNLGNTSVETMATHFGIFPHHADIPRGIKSSIEYAMRESLIKFVICTSTLAQGVNLPIRYMFINSTYQAGGVIKVRDFNNLIGRVGRAGKLTEGCIIFTDRQIYENRNNTNPAKNFEWRRTKQLLSPQEAEACTSTLLNILRLTDQYGNTYLSIKKTPFLIDLCYSTISEIKSKIPRIIQKYPNQNVTASLLEEQITEKRFLLESVECFLMRLGNDLSEEKAEEVSKSTLAYKLADETEKETITQIFNLLAKRILETMPDKSKIAIYSKTLSGIETTNKINTWINSNYSVLKEVNTNQEVLNTIWEPFSSFCKNKYFSYYEDKISLKLAVQNWLEGKSFVEIFNHLPKIKINKKEYLKIEHVVDIFESGISYDGPIFINCLSEMVSLLEKDEDQNSGLNNKLASFQRNLKYGLPTTNSIILYEEGFCDRIIAQELGNIM